jgi:hypothetical protein
MPPRDIQTKDGILLRNIPEGTPDEAIKARIAKIRAERGTAKPAPAKPAFEAEAERIAGATPADLVAGSAPVRFAVGAGSQVLGAMQGVEKKPMAFGPAGIPMIIGNAIRQQLGIPGADESLRGFDAMKKRGMEAYGNDRVSEAVGLDEDTDVVGTLGATMSPAALKVVKALKADPTAMGRIAQGTGLGAGFGAVAPVTEGEDYEGTKGAQIATGAAVGAAIPGTIEGGKAVAGGIRNVANLFTDKGAGRILTSYQNRIIGDKGRDEVIAALKSSREPVPGYKPTAAEAVANVPAGSPIIAHQKLTAGTPGGPSGDFGQRVLDQKAALEQAVKARGAATGPMRESALSSANMGGVKSDAVTSGIDATLGKPGIRASKVVDKTLNSVKEDIAKFTDETTGVIDANDLYTIRKEIGNTIKTHAKDTANWDKKLTAGLERDVQKAIDDAIEAAGGAGWKDYLREFTERSAGMESAKAAVKAAAKPAQRTNLGGGVNVAEESRVHLPQMLSRPMMIANAVMKRIGSGVEPRLDAEAARRYLNPQELAKALETMPPQQQSVISALLQRMGIIGGTNAAASQEQF